VYLGFRKCEDYVDDSAAEDEEYAFLEFLDSK
jgi:hypothetical protein